MTNTKLLNEKKWCNYGAFIIFKKLIFALAVSALLIFGITISITTIAKDNELKKMFLQTTSVVQTLAVNYSSNINNETQNDAEKVKNLSVKEHDNKSQVNEKEINLKLKLLEDENLKLREDNLRFQNILKITASRGIRPRNFINPPAVTSRGGVLKGKYLGEFTITAYTPSKAECGSDRGITASGYPIVPGITVAVDKSYWPIGSVFYVKGLGYVVAMDTGGAIKGKNRMDFAVFDREFAKRIGVRKFEVYLITIGKGKVENIYF